MLHVEFLHRKEKRRVNSVQNISKNNAIKIGLVQTLALIPGFSRSGAAIIGGMYFGLNRSTATNFSFLLAVPVILSATIYSLYLKFEEINIENIQVFVIGFFASFLSAFLVIKFLISYLKKPQLDSFRCLSYFCRNIDNFFWYFSLIFGKRFRKFWSHY